MSPSEQLEKLTRLKLSGVRHHEIIEALCAEACVTLGVDPVTESTERDWCEEIVLHGTEPKIVIDRIVALRNQK